MFASDRRSRRRRAQRSDSPVGKRDAGRRAVAGLDPRDVGAGPDLARRPAAPQRPARRRARRCRLSTNQPLATGWPSPAPSRSSTAALPADHGPRNDPRTPPAAIVARSGSLSNHSPTRSATAIGIQRSSRYASALPSARNCRPVLSNANHVARPPDRRSTAAPSSNTARSTVLIRAKLSRNVGYRSASFDENARISWRGPRRIVPEHQRAAVRRRRAGVGFGSDESQAVMLEAEPPHDRRIDGGRVCQRRAAKTGASSPVRAHPPIRFGALEDERLQPGFRRATSPRPDPLWPPPMTTTSCMPPLIFVRPWRSDVRAYHEDHDRPRRPRRHA